MDTHLKLFPSRDIILDRFYQSRDSQMVVRQVCIERISGTQVTPFPHGVKSSFSVYYTTTAQVFLKMNTGLLKNSGTSTIVR